MPRLKVEIKNIYSLKKFPSTGLMDTHTGQGLDRTSREGTSRMTTMYKSLGVQKTTYLIYRLVSRDHTTCMAPPVSLRSFPKGSSFKGITTEIHHHHHQDTAPPPGHTSSRLRNAIPFDCLLKTKERNQRRMERRWATLRTEL